MADWKDGVRRVLYPAYEARLRARLDSAKLPQHVGVMLDGNRRWARAVGRDTAHGHRAGAANIEKLYWDVAKNYGANSYVMFTRVVFFGALPLIFAGLKIALAVSIVVLVAAEFVASKSGLGYLIWNSWELLQVDYMFVGVVTIGIIGLLSSVLFQELENLVIPWKVKN